MGFSEVYDYEAGKADWSAFGLPLEGHMGHVPAAGRLARQDAPTCSPGERSEEVLSRFTGGHTICAVLDGNGVVVGRIWKGDAEAHPDAPADAVMHPGPSTFRPDVPLDEMWEWFQRRPKMDGFIITSPDGRFWGVLYRRDVEEAVRRLE
jgi:hypothetical protein